MLFLKKKENVRYISNHVNTRESLAQTLNTSSVRADMLPAECREKNCTRLELALCQPDRPEAPV